MVLSFPTIWPFPELFLMFLSQTIHEKTFQNPGHSFPPTFPYFLGFGSYAWCAKHTSQIMLSFHRWLITSFPLASMTVHLNILVCLRFMSLLYGLRTLVTYFFWYPEGEINEATSSGLHPLLQAIIASHWCRLCWARSGALQISPTLTVPLAIEAANKFRRR